MPDGIGDDLPVSAEVATSGQESADLTGAR